MYYKYIGEVLLMNSYYEKIKFVKTKIVSYLNEIFKVYGNELLLRLEEYNLLQNKYNCIESSTAIGFIMEEFIVSKLETYSQSHNNVDDIRIERIVSRGTQTTSYDCYVNYQDVFFMINVKVDKGNNNAVSAINILHNDYVCKNPEQEKSFLVLKTNYTFGESKLTKERKILIQSISIYALEEVDFSIGHKQDHRNWSEEFNPASGRLQVSKKFRELNTLQEEEISYNKTKQFIQKMYYAQ